MYIKHVSSCRGSYALPLMGAFVALCLSACQKPGDAASTPESPSGGGDDEYVTFVLEDENGNTLRAGDGLTPGSTNPLVGEYNYRSQAPNALAYIDLPGTAENGFRMPKDEFKTKGASLPVYLNENAVVVAGRYRFSQDDADKGTTQPLMHETFGKHLTDPDPAPRPLKVEAPKSGDVPNMVYVKLAVDGAKTQKQDYILSVSLEDERLDGIDLVYPEQSEYIKVGERVDRKFAWKAYFLSGAWLPFINIFTGIAYVVDDAYRIPEVTPIYEKKVLSEARKDLYPLLYTGRYKFELTSPTGKPLPKELSLYINYDEYYGRICYAYLSLLGQWAVKPKSFDFTIEGRTREVHYSDYYEIRPPKSRNAGYTFKVELNNGVGYMQAFGKSETDINKYAIAPFDPQKYRESKLRPIEPTFTSNGWGDVDAVDLTPDKYINIVRKSKITGDPDYYLHRGLPVALAVLYDVSYAQMAIKSVQFTDNDPMKEKVYIKPLLPKRSVLKDWPKRRRK